MQERPKWHPRTPRNEIDMTKGGDGEYSEESFLSEEAFEQMQEEKAMRRIAEAWIGRRGRNGPHKGRDE